jgi:ATP-binding cassette, subfamily C (CFTR/MRP), member 1
MLTLLVRYLHAADSVMVLNDDGAVLEHGDFHELKMKQDEFVQNLLSSETKQHSQDKSQSKVKLSPSARPPKDLIVRQNKQADALRKSGDTAVYAYYLKSVGRRDSIVILILGALSVFCDKFPSKSLPMKL